MTTFAIVFMVTSMTLVTCLTGYCLRRILTSPPPTKD